jgi:predicted AAA+ superfamily ATPase
VKTIPLPFQAELAENINLSSQLIQVILGPRQVGKTTGIEQFLSAYRRPYFSCTADDFRGDPLMWLTEQWQTAANLDAEALLVIDEIQKVPDWSAHIKNLWDKEKKKKQRLKLVLLGSSSLNLLTGLSESLTGRFQIIRAYHWNFHLTNRLSKMTLPDFLQFGGYPGSYSLTSNVRKWKSYIQDSIVETVITKDILTQTRIKNTALFKQTFLLLSGLPAMEISYTKLLGQLQDKGNTDLIKSYIGYFEDAFLIRALPKYHSQTLRVRSSSPKIIILCPALIDRMLYQDKAAAGRIFENAVASRLLQIFPQLYYWRDGDYEVDFVLEVENQLVAIEVKSGKTKSSKSLPEFIKKYPRAKTVFINMENFATFDRDPEAFLKKHL